MKRRSDITQHQEFSTHLYQFQNRRQKHLLSDFQWKALIGPLTSVLPVTGCDKCWLINLGEKVAAEFPCDYTFLHYSMVRIAHCKLSFGHVMYAILSHIMYGDIYLVRINAAG